MAGVITSKLIAGLRRVVHDLDADCTDARDAVGLLDLFAEGERLCAAAKLLLIDRIDRSRVWKAEGHRSMAHFLAARTGVSVGQAMATVETARRLKVLPETEHAVRTAQLSEQQTREVAEAAAEDPAAERDLLDVAREDGFAGLKQQAARVKANAMTADQEREREERIHRGRYLRWWIDREGAERGEYRMTKAAGARFRAGLKLEQDKIFKTARAEGRHERLEAYAADALVALADRALDGPTDAKRRAAKPTALMRVDATALRRGTTAGHEVCEINGVGPVSVATARDLLGDALLKIVVTDGVDVCNVTHVGRTILAPIRTALEWMHTECGVFGCHVHAYLEYHHTDPYRETGHTKLGELVPLCKHMHHLVEHEGFTVQLRPDGQYDLIPPDGGGDGDQKRAPP